MEKILIRDGKSRIRDGKKFGSGIRNSVFFTILIWTVQDDPPLPEDDENKEKRTDDISSWDADFLKVLLDPFFISSFDLSVCQV